MAEQHAAVTFLQAAHARAVTLAEATTPVPQPGQWTAVRDKHADRDAPLSLIQGRDPDDPDDQDYSYGLPVIVLAAEWQDEAEANLQFIAANDPASVLRRVAAEREILAEHAPGGMAQERDETECRTCSGPTPGFSGMWPADWPCRTVLGLAKAWGWETET